MRRTVKRFIGRYRSEMLLCAFIADILLSPLGDSSAHIGGLLALVELSLLFVGASYMANRRIVRLVVFPVALIWFFARLAEAFGDSRHFYTHLSPVAGLAISCAVLWALLGRVHSASRVTSSVISEAFIIYLIIAIAFSQLYWSLDHLLGNPFNQIIPFRQSNGFLYFSMTTLSGLGYSTIAPINPYVRLVAALENMIGIFYVAVIVARLVSSYRARFRRTDEDPHR
jgi:hypothetical protein